MDQGDESVLVTTHTADTAHLLIKSLYHPEDQMQLMVHWLQAACPVTHNHCSVITAEPIIWDSHPTLSTPSQGMPGFKEKFKFTATISLYRGRAKPKESLDIDIMRHLSSRTLTISHLFFEVQMYQKKPLFLSVCVHWETRSCISPGGGKRFLSACTAHFN